MRGVVGKKVKLLANKRTYEDMTKNEIIKAEKAKLNGIYSRLETKTKKSVSSLVEEAAFMAASLYELRDIINEKGYTEGYQNGENQKGTKKCSEVEIYIQLSKNYMAVIKQLTDLLPKEDLTKQEKDDGFDNFVSKRSDLM
jgi:flagellar biosynthesis/type III secretory pathway protein FliH